jgi:signal transduction histidine kinase
MVLAAAFAVSGWLAAAALGVLVLVLRHRMNLVARAEHELRGPLGALALGVDRVRRVAGTPAVEPLQAQLDRVRTGLADLAAAQRGHSAPRQAKPVVLERIVRLAAAGWQPVAARSGRRVRVDWRAGPAKIEADGGRLSQALGNLVANALEHGSGDIELRGLRTEGLVRIEVADEGGRYAPAPIEYAKDSGFEVELASGHPRRRGLGLTIAGRAARSEHGRLEVEFGGVETTGVLELPIERR